MIIINAIQILLIGIWTLFTVYVVGSITTKNAAFWFTIRVWAPVVQWILLSPIKTKGLENLKQGQHYIFMPNHASYYDIACLFHSSKLKLHFLAKDELRTNPFTGYMLKKLEMIFIDRSNSQKSADSMRKAIQFIQEGRNVLIFPEGTRTRTGKLGALKRGGFKLAINSQTPIIPVKITGTFRAWPCSNKNMRPTKVTVEFLDPISVEGLTESDSSDLMKKVKQAII